MKIQKYFGYISYNGRYFCGSQYQTADKQTVQGKLKQSLEEVFPKNKSEFSLRMASRTDAGVHAYKNVFDFFLKFDQQAVIYPASVIKNAMNSQFLRNTYSKPTSNPLYHSPNLFATNVFLGNNDFDSRKDSISRKYIYKIRYSPNLNENSSFIFTKDYYYNIYQKNSPNNHKNLKIEKIHEILPIFQGQTYDFTNFYKNKGDPVTNPVRKIEKIDAFVKDDLIEENVKEIYLIFEARSFLRNQIRLMVNSILDYASDRISKDEIYDYLMMRKINENKVAAPSEGLYLMDVQYDESKFEYHKTFNEQYEEIYRQSKLKK